MFDPALVPHPDGYRFIDVIGQGGMGCVFKATQLSLDRLVAIKVSQSPVADEAARRRLQAEARTLAKLNHPNIVHVHECLIQRDYVYVVMEYLAGMTIDELLYAERNGLVLTGRYEGMARGPCLTPYWATRFLHATAKALHYAHGFGVVHRDMKPSNLMIVADNSVRVIDFGIARQMEHGNATTGITLGTPNYMAPEQILAESEKIDGRTDVYALGAVLYQCLAGVPPYESPAAARTLMKHLQAEIPDLRAVLPGISVQLRDVVTRCLQKNREDRFPDAETLAQALAATPEFSDPHADPGKPPAVGADTADARNKTSDAMPHRILSPTPVNSSAAQDETVASDLPLPRREVESAPTVSTSKIVRKLQAEQAAAVSKDAPATKRKGFGFAAAVAFAMLGVGAAAYFLSKSASKEPESVTLAAVVPAATATPVATAPPVASPTEANTPAITRTEPDATPPPPPPPTATSATPQPSATATPAATETAAATSSPEPSPTPLEIAVPPGADPKLWRLLAIHAGENAARLRTEDITTTFTLDGSGAVLAEIGNRAADTSLAVEVLPLRIVLRERGIDLRAGHWPPLVEERALPSAALLARGSIADGNPLNIAPGERATITLANPGGDAAEGALTRTVVLEDLRIVAFRPRRPSDDDAATSPFLNIGNALASPLVLEATPTEREALRTATTMALEKRFAALLRPGAERMPRALIRHGSAAECAAAFLAFAETAEKARAEGRLLASSAVLDNVSARANALNQTVDLDFRVNAPPELSLRLHALVIDGDQLLAAEHPTLGTDGAIRRPLAGLSLSQTESFGNAPRTFRLTIPALFDGLSVNARDGWRTPKLLRMEVKRMFVFVETLEPQPGAAPQNLRNPWKVVELKLNPGATP